MGCRTRRSRTVYETRSVLSGRILVLDDRRERRLLVHGDTLSVYPLDGDWSRVQREYWWRALASVRLPRRPTALFVGLGGGTQIHLLWTLAHPRLVTVIERDPAIIGIAERWFGLGEVGGIEYCCGEAQAVVPWLARAGRRFDVVVEDAVYAEAAERSLPLARALAPLVTRRGVLVLNRHRRRDAAATAHALRPLFSEVRVRHVRREAENALVCCVRPRFPRAVGPVLAS